MLKSRDLAERKCNAKVERMSKPNFTGESRGTKSMAKSTNNPHRARAYDVGIKPNFTGESRRTKSMAKSTNNPHRARAYDVEIKPNFTGESRRTKPWMYSSESSTEMELWNKSQAVRQHSFKLWGSTDSNTNGVIMEKVLHFGVDQNRRHYGSLEAVCGFWFWITPWMAALLLVRRPNKKYKSQIANHSQMPYRFINMF